MENVKVIDQKLMVEVADKYSEPSKLTLSIAFEATMQTHNAFDNMNRVNLLHQIRYQIEDLVNAELRRIAEPTQTDALDGCEVDAYEKELRKLHPSWSNADIRAKAVRMVHLGELLDVPPTEADAWDGDDTHHINHGC